MNTQILRKVELVAVIVVTIAAVLAAVAYTAPRIWGMGGWNGPMSNMMSGTMTGGGAMERMMLSKTSADRGPGQMTSEAMADHMRAMGLDSATIEKMTELMNSADGKRMIEQCGTHAGGTPGNMKGFSGMMGAF